jgi:hypothetical protein
MQVIRRGRATFGTTPTRTIKTNLVVPLDEWREVHRIAQADGRPAASIVREALEAWLGRRAAASN